MTKLPTLTILAIMAKLMVCSYLISSQEEPPPPPPTSLRSRKVYKNRFSKLLCKWSFLKIQKSTTYKSSMRHSSALILEDRIFSTMFQARRQKLTFNSHGRTKLTSFREPLKKHPKRHRCYKERSGRICTGDMMLKPKTEARTRCN